MKISPSRIFLWFPPSWTFLHLSVLILGLSGWRWFRWFRRTLWRGEKSKKKRFFRISERGHQHDMSSLSVRRKTWVGQLQRTWKNFFSAPPVISVLDKHGWRSARQPRTANRARRNRQSREKPDGVLEPAQQRLRRSQREAEPPVVCYHQSIVWFEAGGRRHNVSEVRRTRKRRRLIIARNFQLSRETIAVLGAENLRASQLTPQIEHLVLLQHQHEWKQRRLIQLETRLRHRTQLHGRSNAKWLSQPSCTTISDNKIKFTFTSRQSIAGGADERAQQLAEGEFRRETRVDRFFEFCFLHR